MRNLAAILPLRSKWFEKFDGIDTSIKILKQLNFPKSQLKRKTVKHFARPKQRAAFRKLFSLPPSNTSPDKTLLRL